MIVIVNQAKLVFSVKKGKSVRHSALSRLAIANKRFSSCYKLAWHWRQVGGWIGGLKAALGLLTEFQNLEEKS